MARARGDKEYILPSKGLNTEANLLHFPQEHSPDLLNMEIDFNPQMVRPRKGLSLSGSVRKVEERAVSSHDVAITSFLWEGVGGDPDLDYIVVQIGKYLYFFDADSIDDPSAGTYNGLYDITGALSGTVKGTEALLIPNRVVMANVKGMLIISAEQINPVVIDYNADTALLEVTVINLKIRDTIGIEDGLDIDNRPVSLSDDHKYNLYNQGWYQQRRLTAGSAVVSDPITNFNSVHSVYPSNADIVWIGMVEDEGDMIFDSEWLRDQTFGSSPSARGHYIVDPFNLDRGTILSSPDTSGMSSGSSARRNLTNRVADGVAGIFDILL